jgi:NAD(P)H-hydrate epimerase
MKQKILSKDEIYAIEKETVEKYGIPAAILMENAGKLTAEEAVAMLGKNADKRVLIISGRGNNAGDSFVAARYLFNAGYEIKIYRLFSVDGIKESALTNFHILVKMGLIFHDAKNVNSLVKDIADFPLLIDGIFGTGLKGEIMGQEKNIIEMINKSAIRVLSVDIPSGLDADTGHPLPVAVKAERTITFGFLKKGFYINEGPLHVGEIKIADIGFPVFFYK